MVYHRGFDRVVNFSDAVVAIAATLLILPLVDNATPDQGQNAFALLLDHSDELWAFVLTFAVICRLWVVQHGIFRTLVGYTTPLLAVNFLWLISVVFLPFPSNLIAKGSQEFPGSASIYVGTIALATGATMLTRIIVRRTPELEVEEERGSVPVGHAVITFVLMLAAFALSFTPVGLFSLVALFLERPVTRAASSFRR
ncbi:DUF1211 domain-containing membrane protein [Rhodococcoides trifolii]|uniref:DUF1211 domain-containing membrane protein n=1 Tax=Rhodococcoides trifolii TaxID=908250 RepID=A0A917G4V4_9NOCA|nr:TMEM175 family protein [Rhodococcus trifolii]GGG21858.1 DUF1211 domain-containing membrane protein [Rhodococcus trifolii]